MRLRGFDWRAAFCRWQPYGTLIALAAFAKWQPVSAFVILALIHWSALDMLRNRRPAPSEQSLPEWMGRLGHSLAGQFYKVDEGHRFAGDEVSVTSQQIYACEGKSFIVRVEREKVATPE